MATPLDDSDIPPLVPVNNDDEEDISLMRAKIVASRQEILRKRKAGVSTNVISESLLFF
jgi:hypothetical protein